MEDTICAISTPLGRGAVSIVRLSGNRSLEIMKKVFESNKLDYDNIMPRYLYLGRLHLEGGVERCLAVYFKSPYTYTGEDIVEFQLHGGMLLTKKVLELLIEKGARLAENGEFTRRAFENGKISLDMAESIIDEINAESDSELRASLNQAEGKLNQEVKRLQDEITALIAEIEAVLDYPEEDIEDSTWGKVMVVIKGVKAGIEGLLTNESYSKLIKEGVYVALVGTPNVGKSSTLNALIGENRAIVTEIEGTTRDSLTESVNYKGIKLNFIDTAGIREGKDKVEKLGIEKSIAQLNRADVVLFLLDGSREFNEEDEKIRKLLNDKKTIIIVNKSDLPRKMRKFDDEIEISALNDKNIDLIKERIYHLVEAEKIDYSHQIITNARQLETLREALSDCENILNLSSSMDVTSMLCKKLWNTLGKISGQCENEDIIDLIFSKFCLGK